MGWGTNFTADLYLNRMVFKSEYELEEKIEDLKSSINGWRERMLMFSTSNPKDIIPEDWKEQPIDFIYNEVKQLMDNIDEDSYQLFLLQIYKDTNPDYTKNQDSW